ncbi:MAG: hypothetical protein AAFZ01_13645, partial [Pseudomonadota bacterium]
GAGTGSVMNSVTAGAANSGLAQNGAPVISEAAASGFAQNAGNGASSAVSEAKYDADAAASGIASGGDAINQQPITGGAGDAGAAIVNAMAMGATGTGGTGAGLSDAGIATATQDGMINDLITELVGTQEGGAGAEGGSSDVSFDQSIEFSVNPSIEMPFTQTNNAELHDASAVDLEGGMMPIAYPITFNNDAA